MAGEPEPNFYMWGTWKSRTIRDPVLTSKVTGLLKKTVLGEAFIIALTEKGTVVSWGKDLKNGCLGLGVDDSGQQRVNAEQPQVVPGLDTVKDIQMGHEHVVALTEDGQVYCWGNGSKGQLGTGLRDQASSLDNAFSPQKVENIDEITQIAVVKNSTFALSTSGTVFAWGDNKDNTLGLGPEESSLDKSEVPRKIPFPKQVRKLEIFENRTIIAHVKASEGDEALVEGMEEKDEKEDGEGEVFRGINEMQQAMKKTQDWWNHLLNVRHGQPYNMPHHATGTDATGNSGNISIQDDMGVELDKLRRAEKHIDRMVLTALSEHKKIQQKAGTKNVRFILCMFIDACRLRQEKVMRTISARELVDAKKKTQEISAYSVIDFGANANEEIRKIIAVTKELQQMLDQVRTVQPVDVLSLELKVTLMECLECKLQLHDTRVELLREVKGKPSDPMLPALRTIKDRWNALKHFSLYQLYLDCENKKMAHADDNAHLEYLVRMSNEHIDHFLQIDKDRIISHDTLVPALCYDLLRENAELRKMTNQYQLHVLMLYNGKRPSGAALGLGPPPTDSHT